MKTFTFIILLINLLIFQSNSHAQCNALHFDGADDFVEAPSPFNNDSDFTVEMWFKSESTTTGVCTDSNISDFRWLLSWDDNNYGIGDCNGDLRFVFLPLCPVGGTGLCTSLPVFAINDNQWHHVAYTKTAIETRIYVDGTFLVNFAGAPYDLSGFFRLGSSGSGNVGKNWEGGMDEIRIWNIARTETEIQNTLECQLVGNEPGLVAYYRANQGIAGGNNSAINMLEDQTTGNNDGTLNNFVLNGTSSNWINGAPDLDCMDCITTKAEEPAFSNLVRLFPNPAVDVVTIEWSDHTIQHGPLIIELLNVDGRLIKTIELEYGTNQASFKTNNYSPGLYFVRITDTENGISEILKLLNL